MGDFSICFSEHLTGHPINLTFIYLTILVRYFLYIPFVTIVILSILPIFFYCVFNICVLFNHIEHTYSIEHNMVYYQKVVILPVLVTTYLPYPFILPWFSLANLVQPTRPSSTALLLAGYFLSSLPPIKDWGIPMK